MSFYFTKNLMSSEISTRSVNFHEMEKCSMICLAKYFLTESHKDSIGIESDFVNDFMNSVYIEQFVELQSTLADTIIEKDKEVIFEMWNEQVSKYLFNKAS
jgi:hypothetical protein